MSYDPSNAEIMRAIGRVEGKLEGLKGSLATQSEQSRQDLTHHHERLNDHSERIRKVERGQSRMLGAVGVASAAVATVVNVALRKAGLL